MRALLSIPVGILAVLALAACTAAPPALTPEGARVRVAAGSAELAGCEELRPVEAPESQLLSATSPEAIRVRNRAGARGGNRVVPGRKTQYGNQEFRVFRCP